MELAAAIDSGAVETLQSVKGIGLKTAQRIVVDLKGKIVLTPDSTTSDKMPFDKASQVFEEASNALKTLGFVDTAVRKAVKKVIEENPDQPVEVVIKNALRHLA